jgi:hypothetical protein
MSIDLSPPPFQTPLTDRTGRVNAPSWIAYFTDRDARVQVTTPQAAAVPTTGPLTAAIGLTPFQLGTISAGLYRVTWYARITTAATGSSSLTIHITATDGGVTTTQSGPALTGNTTSTVQSGMLLVRADAATAISYSTDYISVGATAMAYRLDLVIDQVPS